MNGDSGSRSFRSGAAQLLHCNYRWRQKLVLCSDVRRTSEVISLGTSDLARKTPIQRGLVGLYMGEPSLVLSLFRLLFSQKKQLFAAYLIGVHRQTPECEFIQITCIFSSKKRVKKHRKKKERQRVNQAQEGRSFSELCKNTHSGLPMLRRQTMCGMNLWGWWTTIVTFKQQWIPFAIRLRTDSHSKHQLACKVHKGKKLEADFFFHLIDFPVTKVNLMKMTSKKQGEVECRGQTVRKRE